MTDLYTEGVFFNYCVINAISGGIADEKMFVALGDIFCKSTEESERLFGIIDSEVVREVSTEEEYNRFKRIEQYAGISEIDMGISEDERTAIDIKGAALIAAATSGLIAYSVTTVNETIRTIMVQAEKGSIIALRALGILQCEGFLVKKNVSSGVQNFRKAARWGDVHSALALMKYSEKTRAEVGEILAAAVKNTPYENLPAVVGMRYGTGNCRPSAETELIKKAIVQEKVDPKKYDSMYARLVFSEVLSLRDKERIIFSDSKQTLSEACDLPLKLKAKPEPKVFTELPELPLCRENEKTAVAEYLANYSSGKGSGRALCLCSDSAYVLQMYADSIGKAFGDANVERFEVYDLLPSDTEPTKNDLFVRSINERKQNVFFLSFKGEANEVIDEWSKKLIKSDSRSKYRLNSPAVSLDLSSVIVIVLSDAENAKKLSRFVETINLAKVSPAEKSVVIESIASKKAEAYGFKSFTVDDAALKELSAQTEEKAERVLEKIFGSLSDKDEIVVSIDSVNRFLKQSDFTSTYGFGGRTNENS